MRGSNSIISEYIQRYAPNLLATLLVFTIGVLCGSFYCVSLGSAETEQLRTVLEGANGLLTASDAFSVCMQAFRQYLQLWILLSLCGACFLGTLFAPVIIGVRGFVCGFCVSVFCLLFSYQGLLAAALGLLPQTLLVLPTMQMLSAGAATHVRALKNVPDRLQRRAAFLSYCALCLLLLAVFALAALYEGYVGWPFICRLLA